MDIIKLGWRQRAGLKAAYEAGAIHYRTRHLPRCFDVFPPLETAGLVEITRQRTLTRIMITAQGEAEYERCDGGQG